MTELAPYPEYKDSGVEWLGETPSHWGRAQLRRVATIVNGGTPTPDEAHWGGSVAWATPVDLNTVDGHTIKSTLRTLTMEGLASGSALVPSGSVILSTRAPIGYSAMTRSPVAFNQGCKGLILTGNIDSRFMLVTVQAAKAELARRGQGTTFLELSSSALGSVNVPLVPLEEQLAIADFVERETAEIDAFIADQEELIGLLTERRAATITHAVTKGLDPSAPMKDSGIEWLGEVPERWLVNRLSRCVRINEGQVDPERVPFADMILIAPNHVEAKTGRSGSFESAAAQGAESGKYLVRSGQVIYSKIRPGLAKVILAPFDCLCSADMYGLDARSDDELDNRFLRWLMLSQPFTDYAIDQSARVAMPKLNQETLGAAPVWYASIDEQRDIADYLDRETAELDATIADAREAIALSKERRAALISAAVTGKIDVRRFA